jgi:pSer/pThr/pTyr-binding forkhead associated (FHA) protein
MAVFKPDGKWDRMATLTVESPVWLVGRECLNDRKEKRILFDDDVVSPEHAEIKVADIRGHDRVFVIDKGSEHGTWVDGRRLVKDEQMELKRGMTLTFGPYGMSFTVSVSWAPLI